MNKPYIDSISTKSDSKYLLIVAAAKRARQITLLQPEETRSGKINPVSQALHEIDEDQLTWELSKPAAEAEAEIESEAETEAEAQAEEAADADADAEQE